MKTAINESAIWARLHQHQRATLHLHMRDLFAADPARFAHMHEILHDDFLLDYSKNRITEETLTLLVELAETAELPQWMKKMREGEAINASEHRPALHIAARMPADAVLTVAGENIIPPLHRELNRALDFAEALRSGNLKSSTGERFTDVVNIGIGGSHLGPQALTLALKPFSGSLKVHFIANVDGSDLAETLNPLRPESTLFIITGKSFATPETLLNARSAKQWLARTLRRDDIASHLAAVTAKPDAARAFGVMPERVFRMFDWIGGRFSVTSVCGLSLMCAIGAAGFRDLLGGARLMDEHFFNAPLRHNMPVLMALIGIWYNTFHRAHSHAVIPYHHGLRRFPAHIQQLDMESNGKSVSRDGSWLDYDTGPIIWGEEGVNCQHAFFQLLHQGSRLVPSDFIVVANDEYARPEHQRALVANALAQTRALMAGKSETLVYQELSALPAIERDILAPQKYFPGNQPSNTVMMSRLTPLHMGMLLALYEHKTFVQGVIWGINSFDQWGVEYGKALARDIEAQLTDGQSSADRDASTDGLIRFFKQHTHRS